MKVVRIVTATVDVTNSKLISLNGVAATPEQEAAFCLRIRPGAVDSGIQHIECVMNRQGTGYTGTLWPPEDESP
jgi:hypothetical protein